MMVRLLHKIHKAQFGIRADHDIGRITDQGGRSAHIGGKGLRQEGG